MRAPPLPLEDTQDHAFFTLMVKALTTPPRMSDRPQAKAAAKPTPAASPPATRERLDTWLRARLRRSRDARPVAAATAQATHRTDASGERTAPHPYY